MAEAVKNLLKNVNKEVKDNLNNYNQMWLQCDQWLDEVAKEAEKLFRQTDPNQTGCSEEADDSLPIILLPTTPGVKMIAAARAKRLRKKSSLPINRVSLKIRKSVIRHHHSGLNIPKSPQSSTPARCETRIVVQEASEEEQDVMGKKTSVNLLGTPINPKKLFQNNKETPLDSKKKGLESKSEGQKSVSTPNPSPRRTRGSRAATARKPQQVQEFLQAGTGRTTRSQAAKLPTLTSAVKSASNLPQKRLIGNGTDSDDFEDEDTKRTLVVKIPRLKINSKCEVLATTGPHGKTRSRPMLTNIVASPLMVQKMCTPGRSTPLSLRKLVAGKATSMDDLQSKRCEELRQIESREKLAQLRKEIADKQKAEKARQDRETRNKRFLDSKSKLVDKKRLESEAKLKAEKEHEEQRNREEAERTKEALRKVKEDEERRRKLQEAQRKELEEKKRQDEIEKQKLRKIKEEDELRRRQAEQEQQARKVEEERIKMENQKLREIENSNKIKQDANKTFSKDEKPVDMNKTFTKLNETSSGQSYDMTPSKEELPPEPLKDDDNYDIRDLRSDEDTDDESKPRKVVPRWAQGEAFRSSLIKQAYLSPETVDHIFYVMDASIDLETIFAKKRSRFNKRTSSAIWGLPPLSHKY